MANGKPEAELSTGKPTLGEQFKMVGGLIALCAGLAALISVLALAIAQGVSQSQFTQLATAVIGIVASMVGAYYGVKVGTDSTTKALEVQRKAIGQARGSKTDGKDLDGEPVSEGPQEEGAGGGVSSGE